MKKSKDKQKNLDNEMKEIDKLMGTTLVQLSLWAFENQIKSVPYENYYNTRKLSNIFQKISLSMLKTMHHIEVELKIKYEDENFSHKNFESIISSLFNQDKKRTNLKFYEYMFLVFIFKDGTRIEDFDLNLCRNH